MSDSGTRRHFMHLSYDGSPYHGWQRQPNDSSVQQTIEDAIAVILHRPVPITGAGRTDTGVNASEMWAHLDLPDGTDTDVLTRALNAMTGPAIAIHCIIPMHPGAHARFDATSRTYHYHVHTARDPFARHYSLLLPGTIDFDAMNSAAAHLLGTHDFTTFSKLHTDTRTNICTVTRCAWQADPGNPAHHTLVITADRFLRNMVRAVTGTLLQVGRHRLSPDAIPRLMAMMNRNAAGTSMPPHPLFLHRITYPYPLP